MEDNRLPFGPLGVGMITELPFVAVRVGWVEFINCGVIFVLLHWKMAGDHVAYCLS